MPAGTVSGVYAAALLGLARERGVADVVADWSARIAPAFDAVTVQRIEDPRLGRANAKAVLRSVCASVTSPAGQALLADFLCVLFDRHRLAQASDILSEVARTHAEATGRAEIHVTITDALLNPAHMQHIETMIRRRLGENATVRLHSDNALLGGMTVRYGDTLIDASVRRRIDDLARMARTVPVSDTWISA